MLDSEYFPTKHFFVLNNQINNLKTLDLLLFYTNKSNINITSINYIILRFLHYDHQSILRSF